MLEREEMCQKDLSQLTQKRVSFKSLENLDWLGCGFSTRHGGVSKGCFSSMNMSFSRGDDPNDVMENIRIFSAEAGFEPQMIVMPHQCHTTNVQIVGKNECGRGVTKTGTTDEVDGQITDEKGVVLFCFGADCVPVFLVDIEKKVISACHAGWKGTLNNITGAAIEKMKIRYGCDTGNIRAVIGPSICQDCYEVSGDVADEFLLKYGTEPKDSGKPAGSKDMIFKALHSVDDSGNKREVSIVRPASGDFSDNPSDKYFLNLWEANRVNLLNSGIAPENIEVCGICTKCRSDLFFSHRAHGNERGVNVGYIFIR